jgi:hypothetical protein
MRARETKGVELLLDEPEIREWLEPESEEASTDEDEQ